MHRKQQRLTSLPRPAVVTLINIVFSFILQFSKYRSLCQHQDRALTDGKD